MSKELQLNDVNLVVHFIHNYSNNCCINLSELFRSVINVLAPAARSGEEKKFSQRQIKNKKSKELNQFLNGVNRDDYPFLFQTNRSVSYSLGSNKNPDT